MFENASLWYGDSLRAPIWLALAAYQIRAASEDPRQGHLREIYRYDA